MFGKKLFISFLIALLLIYPTLAMDCNSTAYTTYQYTYDGKAVKSPHAYITQKYMTSKSMGLDIPLVKPSDIKTDSHGNIYIADGGNNRIVILNPDGKVKRVFSVFTCNGKEDTFANPTNLFITESNYVYISDQEHHRILEFDDSMQFKRSISRPPDELLPDNYNFSPGAVAVDQWGKIYVVSIGTSYGIMCFGGDGTFQSFVGAQKTTPSLSWLFWRAVFTKEQQKRTYNVVPENYNNLTVDGEGFLYATSNNPNFYAVTATIQSHGTDSSCMPVKKFNFVGSDVLERKGFYAPAGDISFKISDSTNAVRITGPSNITGVALGPNGVYTLLDNKRNKIFCYDTEGDLLYAFGGSGSEKGLFYQLEAICYDGADILALDSSLGTITRFRQTDYGHLMSNIMHLSNNYKYNDAISGWREVLNQNSACDLAYIKMGGLSIKNKNYKQAMEYYRHINCIDGYSNAYLRFRQQVFGKYFLLIIFVILALIFLIILGGRKIFSFNKRQVKGKRGLKDHLLYSFYVIFHPFDGFWDLKHEKRGDIIGATIIMLLSLVSLLVKESITGYVFSGGKQANVLAVIVVFLGFIIMFCIANWCLTSLMDGKGSMKDIYIAVCYSLVPLILFCIPLGILSNFLTFNEGTMFSFLNGVAYIWTGILLFIGVMITHQYSFSKGIGSFILTIAGMAIILFILFLLYSLFGRIWSFFANIITELSLRV